MDMRSISRLMRVPALSALAVFMAACGGGSAPATTSGPTQPIAKPTVAAAAPGAATTAPVSAPAGALKSSKDTLTIVFQANQGSLDGHFAATNQELLVTRNIYSSLLKYKPDTTELTGDLDLLQHRDRTRER